MRYKLLLKLDEVYEEKSHFCKLSYDLAKESIVTPELRKVLDSTNIFNRVSILNEILESAPKDKYITTFQFCTFNLSIPIIGILDPRCYTHDIEILSNEPNDISRLQYSEHLPVKCFIGPLVVEADTIELLSKDA